MRTAAVFGIATNLRPETYVDRGALDEELLRYSARDTHVAIRGESKSGKSWLRQKVLPNGIVVQCRLHMTIPDVYAEVLRQLGFELRIEREIESEREYSISVSGLAGEAIATGLGLYGSMGTRRGERETLVRVGEGPEILQHVAQIIIESGRRIVVEDFHYLGTAERKELAHDLKTLWDLGVYVILIGVWARHNLLLHLNPDLTGRVHEISVAWQDPDLTEVLRRGEDALNLRFPAHVKATMVRDAVGNVGLLQQCALMTLDEAGVAESCAIRQVVGTAEHYESAAMRFAEQLAPNFMVFAQRVSAGIRRRKRATGIYAHAMAVVLDRADDELLAGVSVGDVFEAAHTREPRIQLGNLKSALANLERLQVDDDGRGLILTYDDYEERIFIVDRQLLFFRRYRTLKWPWEELIASSVAITGAFDGPGGIDELE